MRFIVFTVVLFWTAVAWAGDAATIVFSSGTSITINNGYTQLTGELKEFNRVARKGGDSHIAEINIEGSTFFINLAEVALVCRDSCSNMTIKVPKKE